jgi:hypothetical protein
VLSDPSKYNIYSNAAGYLLKVKEQGVETMVSYVPQYDVSTRVTTWHSGKSKGLTYFAILFCEGIAIFFFYAAIRFKKDGILI